MPTGSAARALAVATGTALLVLVAGALRLVDLAGEPDADRADEATSSTTDAVTQVADWLWFLALLVAAAFFLRWIHAAYRAAEARAGDLPGSRRGAVLWWFVPLASFVVPKAYLDAIWLAGNGGRVPAFVHVWWGCWVAGSAWAALASRLSSRTDSVGFERVATLGDMIAAGLLVAAGLLAIRYVWRASARLGHSD